MEIDIIFAVPGACIPMTPEPNDTIETLIERAKITILTFDRPAELGILSHPISGLTIIRKSHLEFIQAKDQIAQEILKERNIDPTTVGELSPEDLAEIKGEIEKRLGDLPKPPQPESA